MANAIKKRICLIPVQTEHQKWIMVVLLLFFKWYDFIIYLYFINIIILFIICWISIIFADIMYVLKFWFLVIKTDLLIWNKFIEIKCISFLISIWYCWRNCVSLINAKLYMSHHALHRSHSWLVPHGKEYEYLNWIYWMQTNLYL